MVHELNKKVVVFIPTRFWNGPPIPGARVEHCAREVSKRLASIFGGSTRIPALFLPGIGTFVHEHRAATVDEFVLQVVSACSEEQLDCESTKQSVREMAEWVRDELSQECVLYIYGGSFRFTGSKSHSKKHVEFRDHPMEVQRWWALIIWGRIERADDIREVLTLSDWDVDAHVSADGGFHPLATRHGARHRTLWKWVGESPPDESDFRRLNSDDVVVADGVSGSLRVWMRGKSETYGPRDIPLVRADRSVTTLSVEFVLALLNGASKMPLAQLLDSRGVTARFYQDVKRLIDYIAEHASGLSSESPTAFARRLIGRMLFLRFLEERGWVRRGYLSDGWKRACPGYYPNLLLGLFETLSGDPDPEIPSDAGVPRLASELFALTDEERHVEVPDSCFDPQRRGSVLHLFARYQFTLDEEAGREQVVSVDPAMLGRVLESLTPDATRKSKGVHYTPFEVARELAEGSIYPRLAQRLVAAGFESFDEKLIADLVAKRKVVVSSLGLERTIEELKKLRIVDPAVGSGSLLVACLEVLIEIETACHRELGGDLRRGSPNWARSVRQYIRECLYGVDISRDAVEIARLRLWLFFAVGAPEAHPLPDLGYNVRVGDALSCDAVERKMLRAIEERSAGIQSLEFDEVDRALNEIGRAYDAWKMSDSGPVAQRAAAFRGLAAAEQNLRDVFGGTSPRDSSSSPFAWSVHFSEVFRRPERGFDVVIANPPYVRCTELPEKDRTRLKTFYTSMSRGNVDLYFAFVERCFRAPVAMNDRETPTKGTPEETAGIAGRSGKIAFVLPSFAKSKSAEELRGLLAAGGHVDRWVDFRELQVFPSASNYVALIFGTSGKRKRKTFSVQVVPSPEFDMFRKGRFRLAEIEATRVEYAVGGWDLRANPRSLVASSNRLSDIARVQVGIQTSYDKFYLMSEVGPGSDDSLIVVRNELGTYEIERVALFACAKGSRDLRGDTRVDGEYVLWPYDTHGQLMDSERLRRVSPRAWELFLSQRRRLEAREGGRFADGDWWRFRRPQGVNAARQPKVIVPTLMQVPTAFHDPEGRVVCTASGSGGGGGLIVQPIEGHTLDLARIAQFFRSEMFGEWIRTHGSPKLNGWWGIDRTSLESCPVPHGLV